MKTVTDLIKNVPLPPMYRVREKFDGTRIPDDELLDVLRAELNRPALKSRVKPGMRVALTCGSRGIYRYRDLARTIVDFLKACGAEPFIVAAMGSHGGATSEGQRDILTGYGITEEAMGCPVLCDMDTVEIGRSPVRGKSVRIDRNAASADGIFLFNRVKPHTSYRGRYESGLMKMMAIGLGKQHGADDIHGQSPAIMH